MTATLLVIGAVSGALIVGALLGLFDLLTDHVEGFLVAMAGGALIVSLMDELIRPATETAPVWIAMAAVAVGAVAFTLADAWIDTRENTSDGEGLLLAITFDGVPENLALGVALVGSGPLETAALAASILLANLPEAAGGARRMRQDGMGTGAILGQWLGAALLLSAAALAGNLLLVGASDTTLAVIRCFAAGAVAASLATEVFPKAFARDRQWSGIAVAVGLILAYVLSQLGNG